MENKEIEILASKAFAECESKFHMLKAEMRPKLEDAVKHLPPAMSEIYLELFENGMHYAYSEGVKNALVLSQKAHEALKNLVKKN